MKTTCISSTKLLQFKTAITLLAVKTVYSTKEN